MAHRAFRKLRVRSTESRYRRWRVRKPEKRSVTEPLRSLRLCDGLAKPAHAPRVGRQPDDLRPGRPGSGRRPDAEQSKSDPRPYGRSLAANSRNDRGRRGKRSCSRPGRSVDGFRFRSHKQALGRSARGARSKSDEQRRQRISEDARPSRRRSRRLRRWRSSSIGLSRWRGRSEHGALISFHRAKGFEKYLLNK